MGQPVGFAIASLGLQLLPSAFWSLLIFIYGEGPSPYTYLLSFGMGFIVVAGLTCLAFAAGWRRSWLNLLAVLAGLMLGTTYNYLPLLDSPS